MPAIPIIAEPGQEGSYPVNFYWQPELGDGKPGYKGTPGLSLLKVIDTTGGEIRGLWDMDGYLYVVCKDDVYRYKDGAQETCTGTLSTSNGPVWMVDNGTQVLIVDGTYGYYMTGTTVTAISDTDFPTPSSAAYQDGLGIVTKKDSGEIYISSSYDFSTWDALDYATAEAEPDDAVSVLSDHRELIVFGTDSMESYYNSGDADFPFDRIQGAYHEKGCGAAKSPAKGDNQVFWFSNARQVLRAAGTGGSPQIVSTRQLDQRFQRMTTVSDAIGYCIDFGGTWYVLTFPTENQTWCFNTATNRWHQWSSYPYVDHHIRHRGNCYCWHGGQHIIGDYDNGCIYKIDTSLYTDNSQSIRRQVIFPPIEKDGRWIYHHRMDVEYRLGVGIATGQGSDPQAMLDWTDSDRRMWSNEIWRDIGEIGEYEYRCVWHRLGRSRKRQYRTTITDPVECEILGANLEMTLGGF